MKKVSIITRTKDRGIFLKRALETISKQDYTNYEWVIVNDGGEKTPVDQVVKMAIEKKISVKVVHNDESLGMEAASNVGIRQATGEYIAIHDDDDTWEACFLSKCVSFLEQNTHYKGVISYIFRVHEKVIDNDIVISKKYPQKKGLGHISLPSIAHPSRNFPPISFLYHKSVFSDIGLYNEDLPVLGDWDFHLRFLRKYDIGLVPEPIANYHIRNDLYNSIYSNTVVSGTDTHNKYYNIILNKLIREDLDSGKIGLGFLLSQCNEFQKLNHNTFLLLYANNLIKKVITKISFIKRKLFLF